MDKPLYTLHNLNPLITQSLKYGFAIENFKIECSAQEGFIITRRDDSNDFFQVINTFQNAIVFFNIDKEKEENMIYPFEEIDYSLFSFRACFEKWLRGLKGVA